jgi:hypothetical protein
VRYVLIIGLAVFRSIGHEHNVLNKGNSERKIILKRNELTESGGSEAGTRQKKGGKQNLEMRHTEPVTGVEPVARKSKGKKQE